MTYLDAYPGCAGCPVSRFCGTVVSCMLLCNSYEKHNGELKKDKE